MAVAEAVSMHLAVDLGVWAETLLLQMGLEVEGSGAL